MATVQNSGEFRGVKVSNVFPSPATVIVGQKDSNITVQVATAAAPVAPEKPIDAFTNNKLEVWEFGANTIAANLAALSGLSKYLEKEVQSLGKPKWKANIEALVTALNEAVQKSNQLCDDTNTTLAATKPS